MALELSLTKNISDYSVLTLIDNTGAYNATTNPTGWGATNTALSAINYAVLVITTPGGVQCPPVDIIADLGINFATATVNDLIYNITGSMLGGTDGDTLADGIWTVHYEVSIDGGVTILEDLDTQVATYYQLQVLVFENIATIPDLYECNNCCTMKLKDIVTQFMLLQALVYAAEYSYLTEFTNILTTLQQITSFDADLICDC